MNKTAFKIMALFVITASSIAMVLLMMNFICFAVLGSDGDITGIHSPKVILQNVSESIQRDENGFSIKYDTIIPDDNWCILIDEKGDVVWKQNKPYDIPEHYSVQDIAKMTRWFLNDYPVYVRSEEYGLIVLGLQKNAVGKYNIEYSMNWFDNLPKRIVKIFIINLCFASVLACLFGIRVYHKLKELLNAINDLRLEKRVCIKQKGIFKILCQNINETSETIQRKNEALAVKENARLNWVSGISHDIRTPLSIVMGYGEYLSNCSELSEQNRKKAENIVIQSMKVKKLIADLNLISSLEYDMQPNKKSIVKICPLLRRIVSDVINGVLDEKYDIVLELCDEKASILADECLLERAIFNLINNSIIHNPYGCCIQIVEYTKQQKVFIEIKDNGVGVSDEVMRNIEKIPKSCHGLGLPMAYRIVKVQEGEFICKNENGFIVCMAFPFFR